MINRQLVLLAYGQKFPLKPRSDVYSGARGLNFDLSFPPLSYIVYLRSDGSGKTACTCRQWHAEALNAKILCAGLYVVGVYHLLIVTGFLEHPNYYFFFYIQNVFLS